VRAETAFGRVESYPEYPGVEHPMRTLGRVLADLGIREAIGADRDGYPGILGYQGPALSEVTKCVVAPLADVVESMMVRKSENEISLGLQRGARAGDGHRRADRRGGPSVRPHGRRPAGRLRRASPGASRAQTSTAVMRYLEENGLLSYWRQHTGHAIGLRNHEAPFLDLGDHTPIDPGMVFTIEPGLYADTIGGFRHSDTVAVESLTLAP
jgi:Xaa-Pro aminopeptidase